MDIKTDTIASYDKFPEAFDKKFEDWTTLNVRVAMDRFIALLPPGGRVVDIGAGPGHKAAYLQEHGLHVHCIDLSIAMVDLCKKRGLCAEQMDLENLAVPAHAYDGVLAWTSLLHMPKDQFTAKLQALATQLKPHGVLFLGMKAGNKEGWVDDDPRYPGTRRWFSLYTDDELRQHIPPCFTIEFFLKTQAGKKTFLNYLLRLS